MQFQYSEGIFDECIASVVCSAVLKTGLLNFTEYTVPCAVLNTVS